MPISSAVLRAMAAKGATVEMIVAAVEAAEEEDQRTIADKRQNAKERQRRSRASRHATSRSIAVGDVTPVTVTGVTPSSPSLPSPEPPSITTPPPIDGGGGGGGGARAPTHDGSISRQAQELADDVLSIVGIDRQFVPPGWCGLEMWLSAGLASNWQPELVKVAVQRIAAARQRNGPPTSYRYLEQPIAREHEQAARPVKPAPTLQVHNRSKSYAPGSNNSLAAAARRALEQANGFTSGGNSPGR